MAYIREYSPGRGCMGFPSIKSSYAYIWWLGLLRVVQALKVIILPLPLSAGVMCCPPLIFKPRLGRREKLPQKVGGGGDLPSCTSPLNRGCFLNKTKTWELFSNIMLQNELEGEVARFITHVQTCLST